jgi:hypothetical protein
LDPTAAVIDNQGGGFDSRTRYAPSYSGTARHATAEFNIHDSSARFTVGDIESLEAGERARTAGIGCSSAGDRPPT